jgi:XTP/dITP diphosphohydrolase
VHSARYAESDRARISRLLVELAAANGCTDPELGQGNRRAQFVAALAVADPSGAIQLEVEGHCPGEILTGPRGEGGFGYDPVFYVPEAGQTFAEMAKELKGRIGHRGRAFALLQPQLGALLA